ncbi:nucleotide sugar dehydrogenase [Frankia nepalensis]|uniref:Nucleotide sugar dehydrogenase n=1 Tax=Frankia nepalensis TaxID=1836974 RepID=A0A937RCE0_9ACTN|nr:nucleotide sugar dehydrogenase [Frankia nepalensis]MBL7626410.1 nucleotide sugar dehydrogenase [Frankia nepalensis]
MLGQGYVGLPLAIRCVDVGHNVVGYDVDEDRVKSLAAGESYIEDISARQLAATIATGRYLASSQEEDLTGFDVAVITVPTPLRDGSPDLSFVESSARTLGRHVRPGCLVVLESTSYPGTTQDFLGPVLAEASGLRAGEDFQLAFSPERIDPGNRTWTLRNTPKVVAGVDEASRDAVISFYGQLVETVVPVSGTSEAELTKLLENTFRHINIALVNELAIFAHELRIDLWESIDAAATKPFGFMPFRPGPGVGGHCLPIDPSYLSWRVERSLGRSFRFVELANDINMHMPDYVVQRIAHGLNERGKPVKGSRVLVLGLAYKRNTRDARESPAVRVTELLLSQGADVRAADPHVLDGHIDTRVPRVDATPEEAAASDAVVLLTDHDAFDLDAIVPRCSYFLDCRSRVRGHAVEPL